MTPNQIEDFKDRMARVALDHIVSWIASNLLPEQVFSGAQLEAWRRDCPQEDPHPNSLGESFVADAVRQRREIKSQPSQWLQR